MPSAMEALIPISMFLSVAAVIIVALYLRIQKRKIESAEILAAIEKGVEIKFPETRNNKLLPGLIWLLTGLVMTIALAMIVPEDAPRGVWVWGLVPVAVGASFLIVHKLENKDTQ